MVHETLIFSEVRVRFLLLGTMALFTTMAARSQEEARANAPTYSVLYTFSGGADGAIPSYVGGGVGLTRDREGNLYGATVAGGDPNCDVGYNSDGCGVAFKLDRSGGQSVVHTFTGPPDGADPGAHLVRDEEGNLYGNTAFGGDYGFGAIFKVDCDGKETILYSFTGGADGNSPRSAEGRTVGIRLAELWRMKKAIYTEPLFLEGTQAERAEFHSDAA